MKSKKQFETIHEDQISRLQHGQVWHIWDEHGRYRELYRNHRPGMKARVFHVVDDNDDWYEVTLYEPDDNALPKNFLTEWGQL